MNARLRRAQAADAAALTALARAAKAGWGYPAEWMASWRTELALTPEYIAAHDVFVAVEDGEIVGTCTLERTAEGAAIEHAWIEPGHQGRGVGRALVHEALAAAAARGLRSVSVTADPFAESFYLRLGARRTGSVPAPMPGAPGRVLPRLEFQL